MEIVKWQPKLQEVLAMDADPQLAASTIAPIVEFWPLLDRVGTMAGIYKAALIYSLSMTPVVTEEGDVKAKWEATQIDPQKPLSVNWFEFCLIHLGMHPKQASAYKRIWEVYHVGLGQSFDDLVACGMFKLRAAVGTLARMLRDGEIDLRLVAALFGDPDRCGMCGYYEEGRLPDFCPQCGEPWEGTEPAGKAELLLLLNEINRPEETTAPRLTLDVSRTAIEGHLYVTPILEMDGLTSYLPPWEVKVIEDGADPEIMGVRRSHVEEFLRRLRRLQ